MGGKQSLSWRMKDVLEDNMVETENVFSEHKHGQSLRSAKGIMWLEYFKIIDHGMRMETE